MPACERAFFYPDRLLDFIIRSERAFINGERVAQQEKKFAETKFLSLNHFIGEKRCDCNI